MIYVAQKAEDGLIKVDYTRNPVGQRMYHLQGIHGKMVLLGTTTGAFADERALHRRLIDFAVGHEWYRPEAEFFAALETLCLDPPVDIIERWPPWPRRVPPFPAPAAEPRTKSVDRPPLPEAQRRRAKLKVAILVANLTNNEVADRLGVSRATASARIRCERTVPTKYLRDLAALLNLSVEELLPR